MILCGLIAQLFGKYIVLASFEINKEYIVKELCVQKEEPDNCCQGSCHLKKELEKQDDANTNSQNQQKVKFEQEQNIQTFLKFYPIIHLLSICEANQKAFTLTSYSKAIFHPPCFS